MTVMELFEVIPVLNKITQMQMPLKKAYEIYQLTKSIKEHIDFLTNKEKEMVEKYNGEYQEETGEISFKDKKQAQDFYNEHSKFLKEELDIKKITLSKEDLGTNKISPQDIFILSSCIIFQIEENVNENIIEQDEEE